jgi:hypothetical protein
MRTSIHENKIKKLPVQLFYIDIFQRKCGAVSYILVHVFESRIKLNIIVNIFGLFPCSIQRPLQTCINIAGKSTFPTPI